MYMTRASIRPKYGFTVIELVIVIVMLGIVAALALPKVFGPNERIISSEGMQSLMALLGAQKRYFTENNAYAAAVAGLDVSIPASSYFNAPTVANNAAAVASVARTGGRYTLSIADTGNITCTAGTLTCASINCNKGGGNQCN